MKFHMVIAICLNLKLWIHKNFVGRLQGHENWAYFYVTEAKTSIFHASCKFDWSEFFSQGHQKNFMIFDHNFWKFVNIRKFFY